MSLSLFDAMSTAVSGLNAQSAALSAISNNVANSQTVGYKATDTSFEDYVTSASSTHVSSDAVTAQPQYTNTQQGTVSQVSSTTSLAVSGAGFFAVQLPTGTTASGAITYNPQTFYTRTGDFTTNAEGNLVNSSGYVLDGWPASSAAGTGFDTNTLTPLKISTAPSPPVATSNASIEANLPATPAVDTTVSPYTTSLQVYDAEGNAQNLDLSWSQVPTSGAGPITTANPAVANEWNLTIASGTTTTGPLLVTFGTQTSGGATTGSAGTIASITAPASAAAGTVPATQGTGDAANIVVPLSTGSGVGAQSVTLNLGSFGTSSGVTQYAGTTYNVSSQTQDGSPQGNFSSVSIQPSGNVIINYSNGASSTIAQIPLVNFANADGLQRQDGQAFLATRDSGSANVVSAGTAGTGALTPGAIEESNVDIAAQFTKMIVAQQAYTANSKTITTANQMMQTVMNMIQG